MIVEGTPDDDLWGCLSVHVLRDEEPTKIYLYGQNKLGKMLQNVRDELFKGNTTVKKRIALFEAKKFSRSEAMLLKLLDLAEHS